MRVCTHPPQSKGCATSPITPPTSQHHCCAWERVGEVSTEPWPALQLSASHKEKSVWVWQSMERLGVELKKKAFRLCRWFGREWEITLIKWLAKIRERQIQGEASVLDWSLKLILLLILHMLLYIYKQTFYFHDNKIKPDKITVINSKVIIVLFLALL